MAVLRHCSLILWMVSACFGTFHRAALSSMPPGLRVVVPGQTLSAPGHCQLNDGT